MWPTRCLVEVAHAISNHNRKSITRTRLSVKEIVGDPNKHSYKQVKPVKLSLLSLRWQVWYWFSESASHCIPYHSFSKSSRKRKDQTPAKVCLSWHLIGACFIVRHHVACLTHFLFFSCFRCFPVFFSFLDFRDCSFRWALAGLLICILLSHWSIPSYTDVGVASWVQAKEDK